MLQSTEKKEDSTFKKIKTFLAKIFLNFFWLGTLILVCSLFINKEMQTNSVLWSSLYNLLNSVGVALLVAFFFSYVIGTNDFLKFIINLLKKVVVERRFLSDLSRDEKINVVREVIKDSEEEKKVYTNIDSYYDFFIHSTLNVSSKNVRSDYTYGVRIVYDEGLSKLMAHQIVTYRLFPSNNGYEPIKVGYHESQHNDCPSVKVFGQNGDRKVIKKENMNFTPVEIGGQKIEMGQVVLKEYDDTDPYLKVEIEIVEEGFDHWIPIQFQALQPTDGLKFWIEIPEGYSAKRTETFGQGVKFHIDLPSDGNKILSISCNQWLNEGAGLFVVVAKDS